jgi:hypothetical protein
MWFSLVLLSWSVSTVGACPCQGCQAGTDRNARTGFVSDATAANFQVKSFDRRFSAAQVLALAEQQRSHLYWHWQETAEPADWTPRCQIVVHASRASYTSAVGRGSEATFGSSWLDNRNKKCCGRRIDLLADRQGNLSALPHELTHIVVSDMMGNRTPPRWLDEGIALLADSVDKQNRHANDLRTARGNRLTMRLAELVRLEGYPAPQRVPAFYAQSASVTAFLARRAKPGQLLVFTQMALDKGYDEALREVYQLDGVTALEKAWLDDRSEDLSYSLARTETLP